MNKQPWILCCWPGLARLWLRGDWSALCLAVGFCLLLNLALVSTFIWPGWLGQDFPLYAWPSTIVIWGVSAWVSRRHLSGQDADEDSPNDQGTLFIHAQTEYLKGDWKQAELILLRCLEEQPRDVEARLLLATTYRRSCRWDAAQRHLGQLDRLDESTRWRIEIDLERQIIAAASGKQTDDQEMDATETGVLSDLLGKEATDTGHSDDDNPKLPQTHGQFRRDAA